MKNTIMTPRKLKQFDLAGELLDGEKVVIHSPDFRISSSKKPSLDEYDLCPPEANYGDRVHYSRITTEENND